MLSRGAAVGKMPSAAALGQDAQSERASVAGTEARCWTS